MPNSVSWEIVTPSSVAAQLFAVRLSPTRLALATALSARSPRPQAARRRGVSTMGSIKIDKEAFNARLRKRFGSFVFWLMLGFGAGSGWGCSALRLMPRRQSVHETYDPRSGCPLGCCAGACIAWAG